MKMVDLQKYLNREVQIVCEPEERGGTDTLHGVLFAVTPRKAILMTMDEDFEFYISIKKIKKITEL